MRDDYVPYFFSLAGGGPGHRPVVVGDDSPKGCKQFLGSIHELVQFLGKNPRLQPCDAIIPINTLQFPKTEYSDWGSLLGSVEQFGNLVPVKITRDNQVVDGLVRLSALWKSGFTHVRVNYVGE